MLPYACFQRGATLSHHYPSARVLTLIGVQHTQCHAYTVQPRVANTIAHTYNRDKTGGVDVWRTGAPTERHGWFLPVQGENPQSTNTSFLFARSKTLTGPKMLPRLNAQHRQNRTTNKGGRVGGGEQAHTQPSQGRSSLHARFQRVLCHSGACCGRCRRSFPPPVRSPGGVDGLLDNPDEVLVPA